MAKPRFNFTISLAFVVALTTLFSSPAAVAAGPGFNNINEDDFNKIIKELAGNSSYHSVTGAGTLGSIFGFEVGLVGGVTNTPDINAYSKQVDANADVSRLPHAGLLLGASVPFGFTGELILFPERTFSDVSYRQVGGSLKWTATELLVLPFNLAVRAFVTNNKMSFQQTISNATTGGVPVAMTVNEEIGQFGLQLLASPNLPFIEPYVGIGTVRANGKVSVTGVSTGTIFSPAYTTAQSAETSPISTQFLLGVNANILLVNLGVEYSRVFETNSYNLKLGFRF